MVWTFKNVKFYQIINPTSFAKRTFTQGLRVAILYSFVKAEYFQFSKFLFL